VEVGPRACLMPIRIFAGSFGGPVLYENPAYVSPNKVRARADGEPACIVVRTGGSPSPVTGHSPAQGARSSSRACACSTPRLAQPCCGLGPQSAGRGARTSEEGMQETRRTCSPGRPRPALARPAAAACAAGAGARGAQARARGQVRRARGGARPAARACGRAPGAARRAGGRVPMTAQPPSSDMSTGSGRVWVSACAVGELACFAVRAAAPARAPCRPGLRGACGPAAGQAGDHSSARPHVRRRARLPGPELSMCRSAPLRHVLRCALCTL